MPRSRIKKQVDEILECCNEKQVRCTYEAVGEVLGVPARAVNRHILGKKRQEASWVVGVNSGIRKIMVQNSFTPTSLRLIELSSRETS